MLARRVCAASMGAQQTKEAEERGLNDELLDQDSAGDETRRGAQPTTAPMAPAGVSGRDAGRWDGGGAGLLRCPSRRRPSQALLRLPGAPPRRSAHKFIASAVP